jgi:hypothetical protein
MSRVDQQITTEVLRDTHHTHHSKSRRRPGAITATETSFYFFSIAYRREAQLVAVAGTALAL